MQKWVTGYTHCQADKISKNKDNFIKTWSELFVIQLNNNGKEWIICHSFIKHNRVEKVSLVNVILFREQ